MYTEEFYNRLYPFQGLTTHLIKLRAIVIKSSHQQGDAKRSHSSAYSITDVISKNQWKNLISSDNESLKPTIQRQDVYDTTSSQHYQDFFRH